MSCFLSVFFILYGFIIYTLLSLAFFAFFLDNFKINYIMYSRSHFSQTVVARDFSSVTPQSFCFPPFQPRSDSLLSSSSSLCSPFQARHNVTSVCVCVPQQKKMLNSCSSNVVVALRSLSNILRPQNEMQPDQTLVRLSIDRGITCSAQPIHRHSFADGGERVENKYFFRCCLAS